MTTGLAVTKKRFAPVLASLLSSSSDISGLPPDSDEDIVQKQQNVAKSQRLVDDDQTVGHRLVSSNPIHGANSSKTNVNTWPSPIISQLPKQQNKPHKWNTKPKSKDFRKSKQGDDTSQGRQRALQKNSTTVIHKTTYADKEEGLVIRQSVGAGMFQKNSHANPGKKILPLQNSFHIITDSEEENNEKETNKNAKAHRTESLEGLSPVKSIEDINTMKSVDQHVVTSTPLQRQRSSGGVSSLPSPILPDVPPLTVKIKRTGTSQTSLAESEKMTASAQKGSGCPGVISDEKIKSDARKRTRLSRNLYKDDDGGTVLFSAEKQNELRFGLPQNSHGRSSERFNNVTTENRGACNSRKSSRLRAKTRKKKRTGEVNKEYKMTSRKQYVKNQVVISVEEKAYDEKKSSRNQGIKRNVEDVADDKSHIESSNIGEMTQKNKVAKRTWQEKKTSKLVPRLNSSEQKKFRISAVPEQKKKRQSVSESEIDLRRSKRKRIKPLEYWRGERIQYKVGADFCREVAGIDSGFPSRQWVGAAKPSVQYQKKGFQFPQNDIKGTCSRKMVSVPYGNAKCELECFSTLRVESDNTGCQEQNFTVITGLEVPGMSAGFVEVAPFCESYSIVDSNLVFHISVGTPIVTIHETTRSMKKGEFFFVPEGVHYSVRNDAGRKVVLIFTKYDN